MVVGLELCGTLVVVLGVLNFALPRVGWDLRWFEFLGSARDGVALGLLVLGAVLVVLGTRKKPSAA